MDEKEEWRDIEGYNGDYKVSNLGNIKSFKVNKTDGLLMKPTPINSGYLLIDLMNSGKRGRHLVHRLVAQAFIENENREFNTIVNHLDGNKFNNKAINLEWTTSKSNSIHAFTTGLNNSELWSKSVNQYTESGDIVATYKSISEAFNCTKVDISGISKCCRGKKIQAGGYRWTYANQKLDNMLIPYPKIGRPVLNNW